MISGIIFVCPDHDDFSAPHQLRGGVGDPAIRAPITRSGKDEALSNWPTEHSSRRSLFCSTGKAERSTRRSSSQPSRERRSLAPAWKLRPFIGRHSSSRRARLSPNPKPSERLARPTLRIDASRVSDRPRAATGCSPFRDRGAGSFETGGMRKSSSPSRQITLTGPR